MFGLSCVGLHGLACILPPAFAKPLCDHTARALGDVLNVFGVSVLTVGNVVSGAGLAFRVVLECTAFSMIGLFACFVCFYPARLNHKIEGLAMGIPALYLGNLARLTATFMVTTYEPRFFEVAHLYLGQIFTMCLLVLTCLVWMSRARPDRTKGLLGRAGAFLFRFLLTSGCMFLLWFEVEGWYLRFVDWFVIRGFILFGYRLVIPHDTAIHYETFNMVTFTSLIFSIRSAGWAKMAKGLAAGLGLFFLLHLFHRIDIALISGFQVASLMTIDIFLCDVGQYLLPVLLLLGHAAREFHGNKDPYPSRQSGHPRVLSPSKRPT
jgi:exosortase/archaeosortase family protein